MYGVFFVSNMFSVFCFVWIMRGDNFNGRNFSVDLVGGLFSIIINNIVCLIEFF